MIWIHLYLDLMVFVFGAVVGSFLNVCVHRMPHEESIVSPPSHCPHCHERIRWTDNIPLVSYVALRGKCRHCRAAISPRYVLIEFLTAMLFLLIWLKLTPWQHPPPHGIDFVKVPIYWLVIAGLIVATFIDFEHYIIPNEITLGGVVLGLALSGVHPRLQPVDFFTSWVLKFVPVNVPGWGVGLFRSFFGMLIGGLTLWIVAEGGKIFFGRYRISLKAGSVLTISDRAITFDVAPVKPRPPLYVAVVLLRQSVRRYLPHAWRLRDKLRKICCASRTPQSSSDELHHTLSWQEAFSRESDQIFFRAHVITFLDKTLQDIDVTVSENQLFVSEEKLDLATIGEIRARTDEVVLPREAMGFGDVKLLAAIGAFLGWEATLFTVFVSSMMGGLIGLLLVAIGRADVKSRIPYGPYIAFGAVLWLFFGAEIVQWYINSMKG